MLLLSLSLQMHELDMSNGMSWISYQEPFGPSSQGFSQSNIIEFPYALQDPGALNYE